MLGIPWSVYVCLYLNITASGSSQSPIYPYINWDNVHWGFSHVDQFPAIEWKQNPKAIVNLEVARWSCVVCAFIFFGFFGFAQEAHKIYRLAFNLVADRIGFFTSMPLRLWSSSASNHWQPMTSTAIPVFIDRKTTFKPSFSMNIALGDAWGALDCIKDPHSSTSSRASGSLFISSPPQTPLMPLHHSASTSTLYHPI